MDLANIECQLAQAQMSRYLAGDQLPEDTVVQLEKHVSSCPNCSAAAEEKKISLEEMLAQSQANPVEPPEIEVAPEPNIRAQAAPAEDPLAVSDDAVAAALRALEDMPEPADVAAKADDAPADEQAEDGDAEASPKKKVKLALPIAEWKQLAVKNAKPMLFGFLLGAVLIGMSAFVKSPTAMLGKKVMASESEKEPKEDSSESKDSSEKKSKKHHASKESEPQADSPKTPDHHSESPAAAEPKHEPKAQPSAPDDLAAATSGVQEYAVAKGDGTTVHESYLGEKPVPTPAKPVAKPAPKSAAKPVAKPAPKPAPKAVVKPAPKPVHKAPVYAKRTVRRAPTRIHRTRSVHRTHHSSSKNQHRNLKPGQGFVKVYD